MRMSMSRRLRELRRLSQNTMLTDSSKFLLLTLTRIRLLNTMLLKLVYTLLNLQRAGSDEYIQGQAEEDARAIFPETTIVRPGPIYGFEDRLLHRLAGATNVFTANSMQQKMRPVHVRAS